jgi:hypothetical protein
MARVSTKKSTTTKNKLKRGPAKVGRPSDLDNKVVNDKIMEAARLGMRDVDIAEMIGITQRSLDRWKQRNKEFSLSLKLNKLQADREVENSMYMNALGHTKKVVEQVNSDEGVVELVKEKYFPPHPTSGIFWLKNRQPEKWRDKVEIDQKSEHTIILNTGDGVEKFSV